MPHVEPSDDGQKTKLWILGGAIVLIVAVIAYTQLPDHKANLDKAFYTDDDGQTWFTESIYLVPPIQHNGHPAVAAQIYSYDDGKKQFCGYMTQYTLEGKQRLEADLQQATAQGKPPASVDLFRDPSFMRNEMQVKVPGANHRWISYGSPDAADAMSIHSPDGSAVDQVMN